MRKLILTQLSFNLNSSSISALPQLSLNKISTQPQLNPNHKSISISTSASTQPQPKLNLNLKSNPGSSQPQLNFSLNISLTSTSTITSTQYGCDIKATQSCLLWVCSTTEFLENTAFGKICNGKQRRRAKL